MVCGRALGHGVAGKGHEPRHLQGRQPHALFGADIDEVADEMVGILDVLNQHPLNLNSLAHPVAVAAGAEQHPFQAGQASPR